MEKIKEKTQKATFFLGDLIRQARISTKIFYPFLLVLIFLGVIGLSILMNNLKDWLIRYESSQPDNKSQAVFTDLFLNPNWSRIFELSGEETTDRVNSKSYAKFMEEKVGDTPLTYMETSAGLSGNKKFIVRAGNEKVATFTLTNSTPNAEIPTWTLDGVEIFYTCDVTVNILTPGYWVKVDNTVLTEDDIVWAEITKAEDYLPEGMIGERQCLMSVDGFMTEPTIEVRDKNAQLVPMEYDEQTHTYRPSTSSTGPELKAEDLEYQALLTAAKTYCAYMIEEATAADLAMYFDAETEIYKTVTAGDNWVQKNKGYDFTKETISSYYRYSDDLYSANIQLTMNVTRTDDTIKTYDLNHTFFMKRQGNGPWLVTNLINGDVQTRHTRVRLTYTVDDQVVESKIIDSNTNTLTPPAVTVPEGKTFMGWFVEKEAEDGKIIMELVFDPPGEDGQIHLPKDTILEPMTLHARFE